MQPTLTGVGFTVTPLLLPLKNQIYSQVAVCFFLSCSVVWANYVTLFLKYSLSDVKASVFYLNFIIGHLCFPCGSADKESTCNEGDLGSIPGLQRCPGEGKGYPLQYFGLENSMDYSSWGQKRVGHDWVTFTFTCRI